VRSVGLALLCVLLADGAARGEHEDYGEQIALADLGSLVAAAGAATVARLWTPARHDRIVGIIGVTPWFLASPAVHAIGHGQPDRALASFTLRALPVAAILALPDCGADDIGCRLLYVGLLATGEAAASVVDIFVLARGPSHDATMLTLPAIRF
jgi:hypothetical protein